MLPETPSTGNPYWEVLDIEELGHYDAAMSLVELLIYNMRRLAEFQSTPGGPLTPSVINAAKAREEHILKMIHLCIPHPSVFDPTIPPPSTKDEVSAVEAVFPGIYADLHKNTELT